MRRFLRALLPLWALFCDLMEDPESWSAGVRPQYAASLLSLRKERYVNRGSERRGALGAYPQDGEQAAVGLLSSWSRRPSSEKSSALSELAARISLARLLASMSFASGWKGEEGKSVGQLPECVPCLDAGAMPRAQRAVVPPACRCGKPCRPSVGYDPKLPCAREVRCGSDLSSTAWSLLQAGAPCSI